MASSSDSEWDPPTSPDDDDNFFDFIDNKNAFKIERTRSDRLPLIDKEDIRVLMLRNSSQYEDTIHCTFERVSLKQPTEYFALSYAWGFTYEDGRHLTHTIFCDDLPILITQSLYRALLRLRQMCFRSSVNDSHRFPIPALWIDAICINQDDLMERNHQVTMMASIYRSAKLLLVWLGEPDKQDTALFGNTHGFGPIKEDYLPALLALLRKRQYSRRRWVVQEVHHCNSAHYVITGPFWAQIHDLEDRLADYTFEAAKRTYETRRSEDWQHNPRHSLQTQSNYQLSLLNNLIRFEDKACAVDSDIVFALRSISRDGDAVRVDYADSAMQIFLGLSCQWLRNGYIEATLASAANRPIQTGRKTTVPSWVRDWPHWRDRCIELGDTPWSDETRRICGEADLKEPCYARRGKDPQPYLFDGVSNAYTRLTGKLIQPCTHVKDKDDTWTAFELPWHMRQRNLTSTDDAYCSFCSLLKSEVRGKFAPTTVFLLVDGCRLMFSLLPAVRPDPTNGKIAYLLSCGVWESWPDLVDGATPTTDPICIF